MATPLLDRLCQLHKENALWLDMPGHHGRVQYDLPHWTVLDRTEHTVTGDLFQGGDIIQAAEDLWAERWGAEGCLFLTGGSTQGNHTALHLCGAGSTLLVDRGIHRSLWNGMALLDQHPVCLERPWRQEDEITGGLTCQAVAEGWRQHPEAKAVVVVSPTYYGVVSPVREIADFCHEKGMLLVVDAAHGAHFPWIDVENPCQQGADLVVVSAHKGLPVPGQSALLFYRGIAPEMVRSAAQVYGSSSPSYWMMGALDGVRDYLDHSTGYRQLVENCLPAFRAALERETRFRLVKNDDPARLVIATAPAGVTGFQAAEALEELGIYVEMADLSHLVCITTCADDQGVFDRLLNGLRQVDASAPGAAKRETLPPPPPLPRRVISLRQAMFAPKETRPLADCAGRIAGEQVAPYPPGVPVVAPGEEIEKKHLAYLEKIRYNSGKLFVVR